MPILCEDFMQGGISIWWVFVFVLRQFSYIVRFCFTALIIPAVIHGLTFSFRLEVLGLSSLQTVSNVEIKCS